MWASVCECLRSRTTDQPKRKRGRKRERERERERDRVDFLIKRLTCLPCCPFASRTKTLETRRRLSASTTQPTHSYGSVSRRDAHASLVFRESSTRWILREATDTSERSWVVILQSCLRCPRRESRIVYQSRERIVSSVPFLRDVWPYVRFRAQKTSRTNDAVTPGASNRFAIWDWFWCVSTWTIGCSFKEARGEYIVSSVLPFLTISSSDFVTSGYLRLTASRDRLREVAPFSIKEDRVPFLRNRSTY